MAKKSFKSNPALQFISTANEDTDNKQYTDNTDNKQERKTKRLNLLIQPSILENLSKIAHMKQTSVNDLISSVLKNYAETEEEAIIMYNKVFLKE
jgi:predicted HicB family RNase H-like nuclease